MSGWIPTEVGRVLQPFLPPWGRYSSPALLSHHWLAPSLQSLSIKTSSLAEAENMADLIDGYCRLQGEHKGSLIMHAKKGGFLVGCRLAQRWKAEGRSGIGPYVEAKILRVRGGAKSILDGQLLEVTSQGAVFAASGIAEPLIAYNCSVLCDPD